MDVIGRLSGRVGLNAAMLITHVNRAEWIASSLAMFKIDSKLAAACE
jgi:hypothetical protein